MVRKSHTGKKVRNPNQPRATRVVAAHAGEEKASQLLKKINRGWFILAMIYFIASIAANQQEKGTTLWFVLQGICYSAMFFWGILMLITARHYRAQGTKFLYGLIGVILVGLSVLGIVALI